MRLIANIVVVAAVACGSQVAIAQSNFVRVCTTEIKLYGSEAGASEQLARPPYVFPPSLPPDFPAEAMGSGTTLVTFAVAWSEKGFEARLQQAECDFVVLTRWDFRDLDANPTLPLPMLNDDIDRAWSMPMQAAPVNGPMPPSAANWLRHFELDGPGFQRVLMTKAYPYSHAPEEKLKDIAKQMGAEIYRVIDSRPRIEELHKAIEPPKLLPLTAEHAPFQPTANNPTGTNGHLHRGKLPLPEEEHFVLARRLLAARGVPFEPFILLQPGGIARLKSVLDRMPEMHVIRREASPTDRPEFLYQFY